MGGWGLHEGSSNALPVPDLTFEPEPLLLKWQVPDDRPVQRGA